MAIRVRFNGRPHFTGQDRLLDNFSQIIILANLNHHITVVATLEKVPKVLGKGETLARIIHRDRVVVSLVLITINNGSLGLNHTG